MTSTSDRPTVVRLLTTEDAQALAALAAAFDDLQMVLRCCERLVAELTAGQDPVVLEGVWTTAVLSYTRCFAGPDGVRLTEDDVTSVELKGDLLGWHRVLGKLREHYADPARNPREQFAVGAALGADGRPGGVAITSTPTAPLDDVTVRQTGALAYELSKLVDQRIADRQRQVHEAASALSDADLLALPVIEVAP